MSLYKEIVTKTIVGKGKKNFKNTYDVVVENKPSTVLGCWVINHQFKGYNKGEKIVIDGSYDVNIWYSYENDSKTTVINKKIEYSEEMTIKLKNDIDFDDETSVIVRTLKQPNCTKVSIDEENKIVFDIEKELGVEIVGDAKIKISVEGDEDPWEDLNEEVNEEVLKEIDKVNENFI